MMYNVHYPNGEVKRHESYPYAGSLPHLNGVFYNIASDITDIVDLFNADYLHYYEIVEIGEEDIWVEEILPKEYLRIVYFREKFIDFSMCPGTYKVMEYSK